MAAFDRDDVRQFKNDLRPERGFPMTGQNYAPMWIAGIVIVAALIGVFAYESVDRHTAPSMTPPAHEMTAPPPANPAPPPDTTKP